MWASKCGVTCMPVGHIHTFTFSLEDKRSVVCDHLKLQLSHSSHICDEGSRDDPLRIHLL